MSAGSIVLPLKVREEISALITRCLREVNSHDYTQGQIERLCDSFTPEKVDERFSGRSSFVALKDRVIAGTVTLKHNEIGSVFVCPDLQGQGIGKILSNHVETIASASRVGCLRANASLMSIGFYERLGYRKLKNRREEDGEVSVEMEKDFRLILCETPTLFNM